MLKIHQTTYIIKILYKFNITNAKPSATPFISGLKLSKKLSPQTEEDKENMKNVPYREFIGSLQYAANVTRPDITFIVNVLSRYLNDSDKEHWNAAKQVLRYLQGTVSNGIVYDDRKSSSVCGYSDNDHA